MIPFSEPDNGFSCRCSGKSRPHCLHHMPQSSTAQYSGMQSNETMGWKANPLQLKHRPPHHRWSRQRHLFRLAASHRVFQHETPPWMFRMQKSRSWCPGMPTRTTPRLQLPYNMKAGHSFSSNTTFLPNTQTCHSTYNMAWMQGYQKLSSCSPVFIIIVSVNRGGIIIVQVNFTSSIIVLIWMNNYNYSWSQAFGPSVPSALNVQTEFPQLITLPNWAAYPLYQATWKASLLTTRIT